MASTISNFKSQLKGGGARPNLFEVDVTCATGWVDDAEREFKFLCKATSMPTQTIGSVDVPFRGRILKVAGDRTFEPWTITIQNDSKFLLRTAFETWAAAIQAYNENYTSTTESGNALNDTDDAVGYFADMEVHQLSRDIKTDDNPNILKSYKFYNVFPSSIAAIDLDFGNNDAVEEFTVELQTQYWTPIVKNA